MLLAQQPSSIELSVVIPMHNSETVIEHTISRWLKRLTKGHNELILVENGSTDRTWELAQRLSLPTKNVSFITIQSPKGMGNALSAGIAVSSGNNVLLSADDLPFDFNDLDEAAKLQPKPPIVIGSKAHKLSTVDRGILRKSFTRGYRLARYISLGSKVGDTQGTFIIEGELIRNINSYLSEPGFLFTTQLVVVAESLGIDIKEVPVSLSLDHAPKQSTVRWADVIDMGTGLLKLRKFRKTSLPQIKAR